MDTPLKKCWRCETPIEMVFIPAKGNYGQKNNWEYWTEKKDEQKKYICQNCLFNLCKNHRWELKQLIPTKKQKVLREYISSGTIKGELECCWKYSFSEARKILAKFNQKKKKKTT